MWNAEFGGVPLPLVQAGRDRIRCHVYGGFRPILEARQLPQLLDSKEFIARLAQW
jgi:hypothetical protein